MPRPRNDERSPHSDERQAIPWRGMGQAHWDEVYAREPTDLDLSEVALGRTPACPGVGALPVDFLHADVTKLAPGRTCDLWRDRAVFHFLVTEECGEAYRAAALRALLRGVDYRTKMVPSRSVTCPRPSGSSLVSSRKPVPRPGILAKTPCGPSII